jgi:two-component system, NarL family, invasion response regulator UvrY
MRAFLLADDHTTVRLGLELLLRELFDGCSITHASDGNEVLHHLHSSVFDMLIMDMNMPEPSGLPLLEQALAVQNQLNILVVSVNPAGFFAPKVIGMGAKGFVNKNSSDEELTNAILTIIHGEPYLPASVVGEIFGKNRETNVFNQLSTRELQVALSLLKAKGILEVSSGLGISASATSTLKGRIFKKLQIDTTIELYVLARQHGIITDETTQY